MYTIFGSARICALRSQRVKMIWRVSIDFYLLVEPIDYNQWIIIDMLITIND